jgi:hypothetical protein
MGCNFASANIRGYDMDTIEQTADTRQLQFWNPATRSYEPVAVAPVSGYRANSDDTDQMRALANGRTWRIAKAERPLKNPKHHPPRSGYAYSRDKLTVCKQYLEWARAHGITRVTAYTGTGFLVNPRTTYSRVGRKTFANTTYTDLAEGFTIRYVTPEEQFAVIAESLPPEQHDKPMAAPGLISYRCRGRWGWIMIGATDNDDAMREALRSSDAARIENLEVWDGTRYVKVLEPQSQAA